MTHPHHRAAGGLSRRQFLAASAASLAGATLASPGRAQAAGYPDHAMQLIVPFPSGGGTDLVARPVAQGIGEALNQAVVVVNKGGAAGNIGTAYASRAAPDGYTLALGSTGTHTVNQSLYSNLGYDPVKDFLPVSMICHYNNVLVVHPSFPAKTFKEFVALIKANPGKYFYGISQVGSSGHLAMELLKVTAGLDMPGIPYKGAATAMNDFLGGQFMILMDVIVNQQQFIHGGKSRPLAVSSLERSHSLPDVPTVAESGFPGFQAIGWNGIFVPAGTPAPIVQTLNAAVQSALKQPALMRLVENGLEVQGSTPEELGRFVVSEGAKWRDLITQANIKVE